MSQDPADQIPVMMPMSRAARDVLAERLRQTAPAPGGEGFTLDHDDRLVRNQLARAGMAYILTAVSGGEGFWGREWWPRSFGRENFKPKDERRDLVRAAALLIAAIERFDRFAGRS